LRDSFCHICEEFEQANFRTQAETLQPKSHRMPIAPGARIPVAQTSADATLLNWNFSHGI
jgi:hypothetical protein